MLSSRVCWSGLALILLGLAAAGCVPPGGTGRGEENDPDFRAGMSRKQAGNYARAVEAFERALQTNPRSAMAHFELGLIYYQNVTNYVAAIYHFDKVRRLQPAFSRIDVVNQLINVCKRELVQEATKAYNVNVQREMERLEQLTQENAGLRQQIAQLQAQLKSYELRTATPAMANPDLSTIHGSTQRSEAPLGDTVEPPAARTSGMLTYRVKQGDTLYSIAKRHGLTEAALRAANPDVIPTRMSAGQEIRIPTR